MGTVIQLKRPKKEGRESFFQDLIEHERRGEIRGQMTMYLTDEGNFFSADGEYLDRLQFAGYTLVKALNRIADQIAESGKTGYTAAGPIANFNMRTAPT